MNDRPLLIAYDDSPGAAAAIEAASDLFGRRAATVVNVSSPLLVAAPVAGGIPAYLSDLDPKLEQTARETAEKGARLAREAGLDADAQIARGGPSWVGIVEAAEALDAAAIIVGSRGLSGVKSVLLGSTSSGVVHHSTRPVLVVPSTTG